MKNKIVLILGVLFLVSAVYSGGQGQYNQNVRSNIYSCNKISVVESGIVVSPEGKIIGLTDSNGQFFDNNGKNIGRVNGCGQVYDVVNKFLGIVYNREQLIYSEDNKRVLYGYRSKGDGGVIVKAPDGCEFQPKGKGDEAQKEVDRWYTNWTILRSMEKVFVNGICKTEYENGYQVDNDFRMENTTKESKKDSVKFDVAENAKAIIHNHPKRNNESHAWPSLGDIISGLRNPNIDFYIVDCYDKATLIRFDQNTGKVHKIQDADRETIAVNLEPGFQKEPAYKELIEKIDKVSTLEELEDLLEKKPSKGTGYNHAYLHMPYVPADFELLKKKVMSLRASEKNKSVTFQNASSEDGVVGGKDNVVKTDADDSKTMGDKCDVIKAIEQLISCMKERNAAVESVSKSRAKRAISDIRGILSDSNAISAESAKYEKRVEECIEGLKGSFLEMEKELRNGSVNNREKKYSAIKSHIIKLFEILRDGPDKIRHSIENVIPIQLAMFLVNGDSNIREKYYLLPTFGWDYNRHFN